MKQSNRLFQPLYCDNPWSMVNQWYTTPLGQALLVQEKQYLETVLEHIFGYNIIQLGHFKQFELPKKSRTSYQYMLSSSQNNGDIISNFTHLGIKNQSIDAVFLPHTLEFEKHPHQILREVERILIAEGKAIFLGFNPYSLYGLWHKYCTVKGHVMVQQDSRHSLPLAAYSHLISQRRLQDWLQLLGFDIEYVYDYFYRPPINHTLLLKQLEFIEQAGKISKLLPAGAYLMVATKRVSTLTPINPRWKFSPNIIGSDTIQATSFQTKIHKLCKV